MMLAEVLAKVEFRPISRGKPPDYESVGWLFSVSRQCNNRSMGYADNSLCQCFQYRGWSSLCRSNYLGPCNLNLIDSRNSRKSHYCECNHEHNLRWPQMRQKQQITEKKEPFSYLRPLSRIMHLEVSKSMVWGGLK